MSDTYNLCPIHTTNRYLNTTYTNIYQQPTYTNIMRIVLDLKDVESDKMWSRYGSRDASVEKLVSNYQGTGTTVYRHTGTGIGSGSGSGSYH